MSKINKILNDLPIRPHYKNKIKHICKKHNIRVETCLDFILNVYFEDLRLFALDCSEV